MAGRLHPVEFARRSAGAYEEIVAREALERLREDARPLQGLRVLHVAPANAGERLPELLQGLLPLVADLGLAPEWRVLYGDALAAVARELEAGLQGAEVAFSAEDFERYVEDVAGAVAPEAEEFDVVVVHDPAAVGAVAAVAGDGETAASWAWRCDEDASRPDRRAWDHAEALVRRYGERVAPSEALAPPGVGSVAIAPAIDPLAPRNRELPVRLAGQIARQAGVDLERPFVLHPESFDGFADPHAAIDAFAVARDRVPGVQLVLAGTPPSGDAEGWRALAEVRDYARDLDDVHIVTGYTGVGNVELGALTRLARVVLRWRLRDGFGLAASEALWQGTPVVAAPVGGLPEQIVDGEHGYLTADPDEAAARIGELVDDLALSLDLGRAGRERVRERFLVTRLAADELALYGRLVGSRA